MKPDSDTAQKPPISEIALKVRTGRGWAAWCKLLDAAGAVKMSHGDIAKLVDTQHQAGGWYSQAITVGYERMRGLREVNQRRSGSFEASASKTLPISPKIAFGFFAEAPNRARWLKEKIVIRKATAPKSVRIMWPDESSVEVWIVAKGRGKCSVAVQHSKLPDARTKAMRKKFWKDALERLAALVTPEKPAAVKAAPAKPAAKKAPAKKAPAKKPAAKKATKKKSTAKKTAAKKAAVKKPVGRKKTAGRKAAARKPRPAAARKKRAAKKKSARRA